MRVPNYPNAVIAREKLADYLLDVDHRRGGSKARLLVSLGYRRANVETLENDLRQQHLSAEVVGTKTTAYGVQYVVAAPIRTPGGRTRMFRSVWQVNHGEDVPRLITMRPE